MIVLRVLMGRDWTRITITRSAVGMLFTTTASMQQTIENALEPSAAPRGAATEIRTLSYSAYSIHDVHLAATRRECICFKDPRYNAVHDVYDVHVAVKVWQVWAEFCGSRGRQEAQSY